ncbi:hypothetical protein NM213_07435 [Pseudomonas lactis]|uniref:hypothetical protein n=1 Tax=Pseudomonas lactis TaxID=1615674 RepID=UPI00054B476F|nr:hypothetical protein [Pseudomonas lactis]MDR8369733.1 hypothetical protein [Pseudomonas lactis]
MTAEEFWKSWLAFWMVAGGPLLLGFAGLAFSLYLTHRHLDAIKEALKNSRYIYLWGDSLGKRGLIWSLLEMSQIAGMILMPKLHIRHGKLDPVDYENFPPYLKRLLKIVTTMISTALIWMAVVAIALEFR